MADFGDQVCHIQFTGGLREMYQHHDLSLTAALEVVGLIQLQDPWAVVGFYL